MLCCVTNCFVIIHSVVFGIDRISLLILLFFLLVLLVGATFFIKSAKTKSFQITAGRNLAGMLSKFVVHSK